MWALDKECEKVIKSAWNGVDDAVSAAAVERKIATCAKALSLCNSPPLAKFKGTSKHWNSHFERTPSSSTKLLEIKMTSLNASWTFMNDPLPKDIFIWHFPANGTFIVRSAYYLACSLKRAKNPSSSSPSFPWWTIWNLNVPLRIKLFGWKLSTGALPTCSNLAQRIKDFKMSCNICGALEDNASHALFECPLALEIWSSSLFETELWSHKSPTAFDCFLCTSSALSKDGTGEFFWVLWEIWNSKNRFIFGTPDRHPRRLAKKAITFITSYGEATLDPPTSSKH
ncbi:hypothetical protein Cgig2_032969 [Carnegiea gigantea]|uniref:Reverse transcriptase zinc-binding domain-containing protein n=1 Tax=Carnegiea gigantea TaxID=171969 RepID=A0A9Q1K272_9CARY|nr:hypothetical protein Cgig2_032969 [Carnegiea gigantea]